MNDQPFDFELPEQLEAHEPPELRGLRRDNVRLLVLPRFHGEPIHAKFWELGEYLRAGDLLVVNNSRTLPAMLQAQAENGDAVEVRLARRRSEDRWDALLLQGRTGVGRAGMRLDFGHGLTAQVIAANSELPFQWEIQFDRCCAELLDLIYRLGLPIRYSYISEPLPLDFYQTVYAAEPGSVEMASAGRPLSWELLLKLQRQGIGLAAISLHTNLSSARDDAIDASHPIYEEEYDVSAEAAQAVKDCRKRGGRVVAVGTTVVRTLETITVENRELSAAHGWTRLHIAPGHRLRVVDALLTGMHEPKSSHLDLLSVFIQPDRLKTAYLEAIKRGYLWHEFGDMNLII